MIRKVLILCLMLVISACAATDSTTPGDTSSGDPGSSATGSSASDFIPTQEGLGDDGIDVVGDPGAGFGNEATFNDGFLVRLDGAEVVTISASGSFDCENGVQVIRAGMEQFPLIGLILPTDAGAGTYSLVDNTGDGSVATASVFFEDGRVYAAQIEGILVVNELATQAGESVSGSFDFSATSGDDRINASGQFNFEVKDDTTFC